MMVKLVINFFKNNPFWILLGAVLTFYSLYQIFFAPAYQSNIPDPKFEIKTTYENLPKKTEFESQYEVSINSLKQVNLEIRVLKTNSFKDSLQVQTKGFKAFGLRIFIETTCVTSNGGGETDEYFYRTYTPYITPCTYTITIPLKNTEKINPYCGIEKGENEKIICIF